MSSLDRIISTYILHTLLFDQIKSTNTWKNHQCKKEFSTYLGGLFISIRTFECIFAWAINKEISLRSLTIFPPLFYELNEPFKQAAALCASILQSTTHYLLHYLLCCHLQQQQGVFTEFLPIIYLKLQASF